MSEAVSQVKTFFSSIGIAGGFEGITPTMLGRWPWVLYAVTA
jgi:hypothetical protein